MVEQQHPRRGQEARRTATSTALVLVPIGGSTWPPDAIPAGAAPLGLEIEP